MVSHKILVTGGAGFIGSIVCSALHEGGYIPIVLDSLVTGRREFAEPHIFYQGDIADIEQLNQIFTEHPDIYAVIHCAALIVVPDSVKNPYEYYQENVAKSLVLFKTVMELGCQRILFSSSASIYHTPQDFQVTEESPLDPQSPYARTKWMVEMVLQDFARAYGIRAVALRYFNPIGADPKMRTGLQYPEPSHALGKLIQAYESNSAFMITGSDWPTRDGSGIRDYIHVWDLARAHVKAIENIDKVACDWPHFRVYNIGTGKGTTVLELLKCFENVTGRKLQVVNVERREGDVAGAFTAVGKALNELDWEAEQNIEEGIRHALLWREKLKLLLIK